MSYSKNLGNVKGKTGAFVKPRVVNRGEIGYENDRTTIRWELKNEGDTDSALEDTIIRPIYYTPYVENNDPGVLKWKAPDDMEGVAVPDNIILPKGEPGIPGVNIEAIPNYDIDDDIDRILYHYMGESGEGGNLTEGTIFLILDKPDPNNLEATSPIAYVYDKENDTYTETIEEVYEDVVDPETGEPVIDEQTGEVEQQPVYITGVNEETGEPEQQIKTITTRNYNYIRNAFTKIEHPIDLTNYYTKEQTYSQTEIDAFFGQIAVTQQRIIDIIDTGLNQFIMDIDVSVEATENEEESLEENPEEPPEQNNGD